MSEKTVSSSGTRRPTPAIAAVVGACTAAIALGVTAIGVAFGRVVVQWWPHKGEKVLAVGPDDVTFVATRKTTHPGVFGLRYDGGYALVGDVVSGSDAARTVTRELRAVTGVPIPTDAVQWEGDVHATPADVGAYEEIALQAPGGAAPAWRFGPARNGEWMIHIHGIRSDRNNTLRTVLAAEEEGLSSLVVSYRGDGAAAPAPGNASRLGLDEWEDVDAALAYAKAHGAERILLAGWSMGGGIALQLTERSAHRDLIAGAVLIGPSTDWPAAIRAGASAAGVPFPGQSARLATRVLRAPFLSRLTGLREPIDFDRLDWARPGRLSRPVLVIHARTDRTVPFSGTEGLLRANPGRVTVHEVETADHSWEYNVAPEWFVQTVRDWIRSHR